MDRLEEHATTGFQQSHQPRSTAAVLPIMGAVFIAFLVIGIALPVLPLHVHQGLGLGTFLVGLVAGSQFAVAILSRAWAGRQADTRVPSMRLSPASQSLPGRGSSIFFR